MGILGLLQLEISRLFFNPVFLAIDKNIKNKHTSECQLLVFVDKSGIKDPFIVWNREPIFIKENMVLELLNSDIYTKINDTKIQIEKYRLIKKDENSTYKTRDFPSNLRNKEIPRMQNYNRLKNLF